MEKKLIKAILDVIKDVKDRPTVYGMQFVGHDHISGSSALYFTDGYVAIKLFCGEFEGLRPINEDMWVSGEQLQGIYKDMKAKDVYLNFHNDEVNHVELENFWEQWNKNREDTDLMAINPEVFKKLAPFGSMVIRLTKGSEGGGKLAQFSGHGVQAIACPLTKQMEEELCKYQ